MEGLFEDQFVTPFGSTSCVCGSSGGCLESGYEFFQVEHNLIPQILKRPLCGTRFGHCSLPSSTPDIGFELWKLLHTDPK